MLRTTTLGQFILDFHWKWWCFQRAHAISLHSHLATSHWPVSRAVRIIIIIHHLLYIQSRDWDQEWIFLWIYTRGMKFYDLPSARVKWRTELDLVKEPTTPHDPLSHVTAWVMGYSIREAIDFFMGKCKRGCKVVESVDHCAISLSYKGGTLYGTHIMCKLIHITDHVIMPSVCHARKSQSTQISA